MEQEAMAAEALVVEVLVGTLAQEAQAVHMELLQQRQLAMQAQAVAVLEVMAKLLEVRMLGQAAALVYTVKVPMESQHLFQFRTWVALLDLVQAVVQAAAEAEAMVVSLHGVITE